MQNARMCFLPGFCDCGWASFAILLVTLLGVLIGIVALVLGAMRKGWVGAGLAIVVVCLGLLDGAVGVGGMLYGRTRVEGAVSGASIDPSQKQRILEMGYGEAQMCVNAGAINGAALVVFGLAGIGLALALKKKAAQST